MSERIPGGGARSPDGPPAAMTAPRVTVFACGEPLCGDDAAAGLAVSALPPRARLAADVHRVGQLSPEMLIGPAAATPVVIVDAVAGLEPGELLRLDLADVPALARQIRPRSTHQLPLDQMLGLAEALGHRPEGVFLGVGGTVFGFGLPLSEPVWHALPKLRELVSREVVRYWDEAQATVRAQHRQPSHADGGRAVSPAGSRCPPVRPLPERPLRRAARS
jgi:hydrogenase maturation protease